MSQKIHAAVTDNTGKILELPGFGMAARSGDLYRQPWPKELCVLPPEAEFSFLPDHEPIVSDQDQGFTRLWPITKSKSQFPAAAILPVGYLRTLLPAASPTSKKHYLPQWAYTAVGIQNGAGMGAAIKVDPSDRWDNRYFNTPDLSGKVQAILSKYPQNRILKQLSHCALNSHCCTAQNIFYQRWEGALPVSPSCNAQCIGCISLQPEDLPPSSHQRISFRPTFEEIVEVAQLHLETAVDPILSFGQGCEGEPLLAGALIEKAIQTIRTETSQGTLHMNTNGSLPRMFERLCKAGLESVRVSMNSANPETYESYYQPKGYSFKDVLSTTRMARDQGLATSINLLTFPGVTDREEEVEHLLNFINETKIHAIQWRNLAMDPDQYLNTLPERKGQMIGITKLLMLLRRKFPKLEHISFTRPKEYFHASQ